MTPNRPSRTPLLAAALLVACVLAPLSSGVPDQGAWKTVDQLEEDFPDSQRVKPCNEQGVFWNDHGSDVLTETIESLGPQVCDKLMLDATVELVQSADPIRGGTSEDGEITVRITFPIVRTPLLVPLRNQDTDSGDFTDDAVGDATGPVENWVPFLLDLNQGLPCTEGTTGAPHDANVKPPMPWSVYTRLCGEPGARGPDVVGGSAFNVGGHTVTPPRTVASVDRIFLLRVSGVVPTAEGGYQAVYEEALTNVALVDNVATETLKGLQAEVQAAGHQVSEVTLTVQAFLTEAQAASGDALEATTTVEVPPAADAGVIITLAQDPPGPLMMTSSATTSESTSGGCTPTYQDGKAILTYDNGCVASRMLFHETGYHSRYVDHFYGRDLSGSSSFYVERSGGSMWFHFPPVAGINSQKTVDFSVDGASFKVTGPERIRVTSVWSVNGDIDRRCDPGGSHCIANGAGLSVNHQIRHREVGKAQTTPVHETHSLLYASPLVWCSPDVNLPVNYPGSTLYSVLQPFVGCFTTIWSDSREHQVQAFNDKYVVESSVLDLQQYPGYITPGSGMRGSICCTTTKNMPQLLDMSTHFLGFVIEVA